MSLFETCSSVYFVCFFFRSWFAGLDGEESLGVVLGLVCSASCMGARH